MPITLGEEFWYKPMMYGKNSQIIHNMLLWAMFTFILYCMSINEIELSTADISIDEVFFSTAIKY